jgi:HEAT repeat protein
VKNGGGVVVYHSAGNAFPGWPEFNEIMGVSGFSGRDENSGPYVYWKDGRTIEDSQPGIAGYHAQPQEFLVVNRDSSHPITAGLPAQWMHARDELYSLLRGSSGNLHILATAYSDPAQAGTGRHEPMLFTVSYGTGRIFRTVLGHAESTNLTALECVGFIVTFQRGAEWAATGQVTQKIPGDFPGTDRDVSTPADVRLWPGFSPPSLEAILKEISTYDYGQNESVLWKLKNYVLSHKNSADSRNSCEEKFIEFLNSGATLAAKMEVCRHLRLIGSEKSVPILQQMLHEEDTTDLARYALEKIPGAAADRALISALNLAQREIKLGIISTLGQRRAAEAVTPLAQLLQDRNPEVARAAAAALGQAASAEAGQALVRALDKARGPLKGQVASSLLVCAEALRAQKDLSAASPLYSRVLAAELPLPLRQAGMKGKIATLDANAAELVLDILQSRNPEMHSPAISMIPEFFDESRISKVCSLLPGLPEASQVQLISVLSAYPSQHVLPAILAAAKGPQKMARLEALKALGRAGDSSTVEFLATTAARSKGQEQEAARRSLGDIKGKEVDRAILFLLVSHPDEAVQQELIRSIEARQITAGTGLLIQQARTGKEGNRLEAIKALKTVAGPSDLSRLLDLLLQTENEDEQEEMENTVAAISRKNPAADSQARIVEKRLEGTKEDKARSTLYRVLGKIGAESSLPLLRSALREGSPVIHDAVVRALAGWPTIAARDDLLEITRTSKETSHQVLALQGYIRMVGMEKYRSPEAATNALKEALGLAARPDEKKLILAALQEFACPASLELAQSLASDAEVKEEVQAAISLIKEKIKK